MACKRSGVLFCIIGPAGGGKTTFCDRLLHAEKGSLGLSVSVTTRPPRQNERDGESYFFVSPSEFQRKVDAGEFFEHEEIHGKRYGTLKSTVESALAGERDLLLDIDIQGALNFKRRLPEHTIIVFLAPPNVEVLKSRLRSRGKMSESEFETRLATARREYAQIVALVDKPGSVDYFVINDVADETYAVLHSILVAERARLSRFSKDSVLQVCHVD